jgi:phosphoketolase
MNAPAHDGALACCTADALPVPLRARIEVEAAALRAANPSFESWANGYGAIVHDPLTQWRVHQMLEELRLGNAATYADLLGRMAAADRLASAGMWLVVHMTYARRVRTDGEALSGDDFKPEPEGHTGGSLNMVPAYVAYLLANALSGHTRAWLMGQGHCVAAIDAVNVLVGNMSEAHAARYDTSDAGLTRLTNDFYSYRIRPDGMPDSPLGSHVNAHTAGGLIEGGYLGFAELLYPHLPLTGERLVAFLSDGAFEEQRGGDWAPRWWRPQDCGFVAPIMILNGRRIEQRSSIAQEGGERWLDRHLRLNGFDPIGLDGRDPASIAWGIWEMEARLGAQAAASQRPAVPIRLGYGIAEVPKGYGFPGAGTNRAHNLPLPAIPAHDAAAREAFNTAARKLWVPPADLNAAVTALQTHTGQQRALERDNAIAQRNIASPVLPSPEWTPADGASCSPMDALDTDFLSIVRSNPHLRARVGNPDELRSNKLDRTLDALKHRVDRPESGVAESQVGAVITALNEEAVICAALGNTGGLNLVVTYEAFAVKMLGALRQTIIFARHQKQAGHPAGWLSVPILLTSHTWENGKNEQSHQDPTLTEALLGEMADTVRVMFPVDANSAIALLRTVYRSQGKIAAMVVPKRPVPSRLSPAQAEQFAERGMLVVEGDPTRAQLLLISCGAYQLTETLRARARLGQAHIAVAVIALGEPARLRTPRDELEASVTVADAELLALMPPHVPRVVVTHTRPEPMLGTLRRLDTGPKTTSALGYRNHGGTLDANGLLFANGCSWAHVVQAAASVLDHPLDRLLTTAEQDALAGRGDPAILR